MKRLIPITFLGLLLYNTLGLAVAVLCFDKTFEKASMVENALKTTIFAIPAPSLPYTASWENEDGTNGLIKKDGEFYNVIHQKIERDTLYVTLQINVSAREKFVELAGSMNDLTETGKSKNTPSDHVMKLLRDLVKMYINSGYRSNLSFVSLPLSPFISFSHSPQMQQSPCKSLDCPPPEHA